MHPDAGEPSAADPNSVEPNSTWPGVHDLGGTHGWGSVPYESDEPPFHAAWERRVFGLLGAVTAASAQRPGEFRYALERLHPDDYFDHGYYGRWLAGFELLLAEYGVISPDEMASALNRGANRELQHRSSPIGRAAPTFARDPALLPPDVPVPPPQHRGVRRDLAPEPRFAVGDRVAAPAAPQPGHTRLPAYVVDKPGTVVKLHPAEVLPDSTAHDLGERPQHVYCVGYDAQTLWGDNAEPNTSVYVDLYECYLNPTNGAG